MPPQLSSRSHHHQQNHHRHHNQQQSGNRENSSHSHGRHNYVAREGSLSTIAEESGSYHSTSNVHMETTKSQVSTLGFLINILLNTI